jgi:hypothetical protein
MRARLKTVVTGVAVALACGCVVPVAAQAAFALEPGSAGFNVTTSSDQAGAHADLTTSFAFAQNEEEAVGGILRNAEVVLPVGFAGYPAAVKTCSPVQLQSEDCPVDAQIGTINVVLRFYPGFDIHDLYPVYNMVPAPNETAVFGFVVHEFLSANIVLSVGSDYRVHAKATNVIAATEVLRQSLTVWGVPADPSHDAQRGSRFNCQQFGEGPDVCSGGGFAANENPIPYLVNPTQCTPGEPLVAELRNVESWEGEKVPTAKASMGPFTGCESLTFAPTIAVAPEQTQATTPTGYQVDLKVPQTEGAEGLATADLKNAVVRMPAGVVLSPSAANGLVACSEAQIALHSESPVECPAASKLGSVSLITPALTGELKGLLYLGGPPSGTITGPPFTLYLTFAGHGVLVKIRGTATPDPVTGQITTVFDENPELPFSELKLTLNGGSRATLANPSACGSYRAESDLTPWSSPFEPDATPSSLPFEITGCQSPRFNPSFTAGTVSNQAGGYSPLSVTFSREDADQQLAGITVITPPGLVGSLAHIPLCAEPQAAQGTCGPESQIGELTAGAGPGPEPYFIKGGRVYLTGPYGGAPFGLSIDVSEKAGPFDLGTGPCDCEVVRATVNVDPHTAQLTVSNQALPTIKDGIPFQVKTVNVNINRPEFIFNPTSCDPMSVTGTLSSTQGASTPVQSHFQVTNCAALAFHPKFSISTSGKTSKANGASLTAKLTFPNTPQGTEANIARVKVDLPKQLPSRLTTLQKACTAAQFEANPAGCPSASIVGHAKAITPILPVPLEGPAYFVSHGGEAFPSLIVVLQGYGVTVDLVGTTFISKAGITSSTFKTVPDVPVGSFELNLPEGKFSALAANGDLCSVKGGLKMPTEFTAQNGAVLKQDTAIAVTGCLKAKTAAQLRVQKLAAALKACHNGKSKSKRAACERRAHRQYGPVKKKKK